MPGVLIVEAMAQVAGYSYCRKIGNRSDKSCFCHIDSAKFREARCSGDQLRLEVRSLKLKPSVAKIHAVATVDGAVAAEADIICRLVDNTEVAAAQ